MLIASGVMRGRSAAYDVDLLLLVLIVPLATWSLVNTGGRAATPFAEAVEFPGIVAVRIGVCPAQCRPLLQPVAQHGMTFLMR